MTDQRVVLFVINDENLSATEQLPSSEHRPKNNTRPSEPPANLEIREEIRILLLNKIFNISCYAPIVPYHIHGIYRIVFRYT